MSRLQMAFSFDILLAYIAFDFGTCTSKSANYIGVAETTS